MAIDYSPPTAQDVPVLGEIFFRAFKDLYDRFGLPLDLPSVEIATAAMGMFVSRPDFFGVVARKDGRPIGSNFVQLSDPVATIGPITVQPGEQCAGVGRELMRRVTDHALEHHPQVRLVQDAINMASLSLYTSLGFGVQEPLVLMSMPRAQHTDESVRAVEPRDLGACDELCRQIYKVSRRNELAFAVENGRHMGMIPYLRERDGQIVGYAIPHFFGHGVASTNDDLFAILATAGKVNPEGARNFLCPSRNAELYRMLLKAGCRATRALQLMSMGPYQAPTDAWFPSIGY